MELKWRDEWADGMRRRALLPVGDGLIEGHLVTMAERFFNGCVHGAGERIEACVTVSVREADGILSAVSDFVICRDRSPVFFHRVGEVFAKEFLLRAPRGKKYDGWYLSPDGFVYYKNTFSAQDRDHVRRPASSVREIPVPEKSVRRRLAILSKM